MLESDEFRVTASPVHHLIPNIGLAGRLPGERQDRWLIRAIRSRAGGGAPGAGGGCAGARVRRSFIGHTSPDKAGEIASRPEAGSLFLIHYKTRGVDVPGLALSQPDLQRPGLHC